MTAAISLTLKCLLMGVSHKSEGGDRVVDEIISAGGKAIAVGTIPGNAK
ncbi:hypothetical protein QUB08_26330 [Microcoleus sp. BR0-C5]